MQYSSVTTSSTANTLKLGVSLPVISGMFDAENKNSAWFDYSWKLLASSNEPHLRELLLELKADLSGKTLVKALGKGPCSHA